MKSKIYSFSFAAIAIITCFTSKAQITITESDMPHIGEIFVWVNDSTPTVTPGSGGAGQTWNLSAIHNNYIDTEFCVNPASTPYSGLFPTSNIELSVHTANGNMNNFYNLSSTAMVAVGQVTPTMILSYSQMFFSFPLTYLSHWESNVRQVSKKPITSGSYDSMEINAWYSCTETVDGWGTVITPSGSYNSLRLKYTQTTIKDSIFEYSTTSNSWVFMSVITPTEQIISYSWIVNSIGVGVASIGEYNLGSGTKYSATYLQFASVGLNKITLDNEVNIYPNPGNGEINVKLGGAGYNSLKLYDMLGREVYSQNLNAAQRDLLIKINECNLPCGIYLMQIENQGGNINKRVEIEHL